MKYRFQYGGEDDSTGFFHKLLDNYEQQMALPSPTQAGEEIEDLPDDSDPAYEELLSKYQELEEKFNTFSSQPQSLPQSYEDDSFLNFLFSDDDRLPIDWDNAPSIYDSASTEYNSPTNYNVSNVPSTTDLKAEISRREGNYDSLSPNSSGTGKYQFLWNLHGKDIERVTGVSSREQFRKSPEAQEQFFEHWDRTTLTPQAQQVLPKLQQYFPNITAEQAKMMIHFGGLGNVQKAIKTGEFDKPLDANGTSLKKYVFKKQNGGYAVTPQQQYVGLNDPSHDEMYFPMQGMNTFRGLDNGQPVMLTDELGNEQILHNNKQTASMFGSVYEKRV